MATFDFRPEAERTGVWKALPHGSHKFVVKALLADDRTTTSLADYRAGRASLEALADVIARATGNLVGLQARNAVLKDVPLDPANDGVSCWHLLPPGTESDIAEAIAHDAELAGLLSSITDAYLVNRISRMTGLAIGQQALKYFSEIGHFLMALVKRIAK